MKILLGVSGGLDSTYAAIKLKREGHTVEGAVLKMHEYTDLASAREAMSAIGVPLHEIDCTDSFECVVKDNFVREYARGRTPNPCIICNREVKLKELCKYAKAHGFDRVATGHYSVVTSYQDGIDNNITLMRAKDSTKDQTYMLCRLDREELSMLMLPLGEQTKANVREQAREMRLSSAEKAESQEICFLPKGDYPAYIEEKLGTFPEGDFVTEDGVVIGRHKGIIRYTVGQRKGLGVSHTSRLFVSSILPEDNKIVLSERGSLSKRIELTDMVCTGLSDVREERFIKAAVQLRYRAKLISATVLLMPQGRAEINLENEAVSVTPGQSAVIYDGDYMLASGIINIAD